MKRLDIRQHDVFISWTGKDRKIKEQIAGVTWQKGGALFRYIWPTDTNYEGNNENQTCQVIPSAPQNFQSWIKFSFLSPLPGSQWQLPQLFHHHRRGIR